MPSTETEDRPSAAGSDPESESEPADESGSEGPTVRSFRTKRGRCVVDDTYLHVEESYWGYYRNLYDDYWAGGWFGKVVVVGTAFVPLYGLWAAYRLLSEPFGTPALVLGGLVAAFFAFSAYRRVVRGYTSASRIPLRDVRAVRTNRGSKGLTRPRFLVEYDADGATRRRYLMLASLHTPDGEERFEEARRALDAAGLPVE